MRLKHNKTQVNEGLIDYKFYCFNGHVKYLYISKGLENHDTAEISFLTTDWKPAPFKRTDYKSFTKIPQKPINYSKMLEIAEYLSKDLSFVRIDLFEINGKVYFSEYTFYPCSGFMQFEPEEWDLRVGSELRIV